MLGETGGQALPQHGDLHPGDSHGITPAFRVTERNRLPGAQIAAPAVPSCGLIPSIIPFLSRQYKRKNEFDLFFSEKGWKLWAGLGIMILYLHLRGDTNSFFK